MTVHYSQRQLPPRFSTVNERFYLLLSSTYTRSLERPEPSREDALRHATRHIGCLSSTRGWAQENMATRTSDCARYDGLPTLHLCAVLGVACEPCDTGPRTPPVRHRRAPNVGPFRGPMSIGTTDESIDPASRCGVEMQTGANDVGAQTFRVRRPGPKKRSPRAPFVSPSLIWTQPHALTTPPKAVRCNQHATRRDAHAPHAARGGSRPAASLRRRLLALPPSSIKLNRFTSQANTLFALPHPPQPPP